MNGGYIELVNGDYEPTHNTIISLVNYIYESS